MPVVLDHEDGFIIVVAFFAGFAGSIVAEVTVDLPMLGYVVGVVVGAFTTIRLLNAAR